MSHKIQETSKIKDEQIAMDALRRMINRGINVQPFLFRVMKELCYNDKNQNDEKQNDNNIKAEDIKISQLTNVENMEMCKYGHGAFRERLNFLKNKCIQCSSMNAREYCFDCCCKENNSIWSSDLKPSTVEKHIYCEVCRKENAERIKKKIETDKIVADIIRRQLINNPTLEKDLLCNMKRRAALDSLINDINKLRPEKRACWVLFVLDLDYLKAWNTCIGHVATDKLIKKIGDILNKYVKKANDGLSFCWKSYSCHSGYSYVFQSFVQSFVFRTGGDEFVIALECKTSAYHCELGPFYNELKSEINSLGVNIKECMNENEWKEAEEKLNKATDRNKNKINMKIVGISCGIFIPYPGRSIITDWLSIGDKIALETAKKTNGIKKNGCAIYCEKNKHLVPNDKVLKCLEMGVYKGLK